MFSGRIRSCPPHRCDIADVSRDEGLSYPFPCLRRMALAVPVCGDVDVVADVVEAFLAFRLVYSRSGGRLRIGS